MCRSRTRRPDGAATAGPAALAREPALSCAEPALSACRSALFEEESDSADDRLERRLSDELSTELLGEEAADSPRSPPAADPWVAGAAAAAGLPLAHLAPALCGLVAAGARPGATLERLSSMLVPGGAAQPPKELASPGSSPRRGDTATGLPLQLADKERREAAIDALSLRLRLSFSPPH